MLKQGKTQQLEGLRGILAIIVLIHHFILLYCPNVFIGSFNLQDFVTNPYAFNIILAQSPLNIFMSGHIAVCSFFAISGYVLTLSYRRTNDFSVLQSGMIKRYVRLAIPVLAACVITYLLFLGGAIAAAKYPKHNALLELGKTLFQVNLGFYDVIKMGLVEAPLKGSNQYLPVLWTIQVEFIGALALFAFLMLTHNLRKKWILGAVIIFFCILLERYYAMLVFAGGLVCIYEEQITYKLRGRSLKIILLLLFFFFAGISNIDPKAREHTMYSFANKFTFNIYPYFHNMASVILLVLAISSTTLKKVFVFSVLQWLGKLSFAVYLLHLPIIYCLGSSLMWYFSGKINPYLLFSICASAVIIVSEGFYYLVDKQAIHLSNKLAQKFMKLPAREKTE